MRHLRNQHPELNIKIIPNFYWAPKLVEELVRLIGESIRKNNGLINQGLKAVDWNYVTNEFNNSTDCKMSLSRVKDKWNNLVNQLPEIDDSSEAIAKNWYDMFPFI